MMSRFPKQPKEPLQPPSEKYASLSAEAKKVIDSMLDMLVNDGHIASHLIREGFEMSPGSARRIAIELMDKGWLKLWARIEGDEHQIGWLMYSAEEGRYCPVMPPDEWKKTL